MNEMNQGRDIISHKNFSLRRINRTEKKVNKKVSRDNNGDLVLCALKHAMFDPCWCF